jgi:hypothetical protein
MGIARGTVEGSVISPSFVRADYDKGTPATRSCQAGHLDFRFRSSASSARALTPMSAADEDLYGAGVAGQVVMAFATRGIL